MSKSKFECVGLGYLLVDAHEPEWYGMGMGWDEPDS
jgi:hypothetical protein